MFGRPQLKTPDQLAVMRRAGLVVGETLEVLRAAVRPGVTPRELDALAEESIRSRGALPNFLGYYGFPASICTSVNDSVVHGIPDDSPLAEGDLISIDCGAMVDGWHGDAAISLSVGPASADVAELLRVTEESMWAGISAARLGGRVSDIGHAVESYIRSQPGGERYGIVEEYFGHGIGTEMHMDPDVPNYGKAGHGPKLQRGIALCCEPMVTLGTKKTHELDDEWTVKTDDGSWAAHFEHTFALTASGLWALTALDGGRSRLGELYGGPE
ncbi:type I methionyl aminopeptidase [Nocardioides sp. Kera G14]|uniref:type I methionyl aminopeptidase n=1 Tax=Nocardioides sp. Kera G14 TaxID=2884264 RepID=UPI001D112F79|nr:type I methionyl aminopeptidase [Nocardioides sp. Kera G14]UDY24261.1 type I methionyl aminopeptidase [Nocardioides sp. Kera G14]